MEQGLSAGQVSGHVKLVKGKRRSVWFVKFRLADGRQVQRRLGPAWTERTRPPTGYFTRKLAEGALRELLSDARRGTLPTGITPVSTVTFEEAAEEWFAWIRDDRQRKPSTLSGYRSLLDSALLPEFGELQLERVTERVIDGYRVRLVRDGKLSPRSINKRLIALHAILKRAQRLYGLARNPAALVERQPVRSSRDIRVYTPEEIEALARACASELDSAIVRIAAYTGLRQGELRALMWRDVDFAKQIIHVRRNFVSGSFGAPKSGRVRSVPLSDQAARVLDELSRRKAFTRPDDLVFPGVTGGPFDDSALRRRYYAAIKRAGLPRLTFHELRHTFGTIAAQVFPITDVQSFLGHAHITTTQVYLHHVPKHDAAERLSRLFTTDEPDVGVRSKPHA